MPIFYKIFEKQGLIYTQAHGNLTLLEFFSHISKMDHDQNAQQYSREIFDFRHVNSMRFSYGAINAIITWARKNEDRFVENYKVAVVATKNLHYAAAKIYEILSSDAKWKTRVFREIDSAADWLNLILPADIKN